MSRKLILSLFTGAIIMALMVVGLHVQPVKAQEPTLTPTAVTDETADDVRMEVTGTVVSVTPVNGSVSIVILDTDEGEIEVKVNPASIGADKLTVDAEVTVVVSVEDDGEEMVVKEVALVEPEATEVATEAATEVPTEVPTEVATEVATEVPTAVATEAATCGGNNAHPVATRLAAEFNVSYDVIMGWHCQGMGFGNIAKAYLLARKTGKTAAEYLNDKLSGKGWGQIMKDADVKPGELAPGQVIKGNKHNGDDTATNGKGKGKGNKDKGGKGKGNGKKKG
jgi:hypothetical protein